MVLSNPILRNYRQEDSSYLMELYDLTLANKLHFVRYEDFLKHFMGYPGVDEEGVVVVEVNDKITGLAIISITTEIGKLRQGNIIELLAKDFSSMHVLIRAALDYCKRKDVDLIVVAPPPSRATDEVFKNWIKFETSVMMTKMLSLPSLLRALLSNDEITKSYAGKKFVFHIDHEIAEVKINSEAIEVNEVKSEPRDATAVISISPQTFLEIIFGQINPYIAYLTGRVRIPVMKNPLQIIKLFHLMKVVAPFYTSLVDRL